MLNFFLKLEGTYGAFLYGKVISKNIIEKAFTENFSSFPSSWFVYLKIVRIGLLWGEIFFFLEYFKRVYKNWVFHADLKNVNVPYWQNVAEKVTAQKQKYLAIQSIFLLISLGSILSLSFSIFIISDMI